MRCPITTRILSAQAVCSVSTRGNPWLSAYAARDSTGNQLPLNRTALYVNSVSSCGMKTGNSTIYAKRLIARRTGNATWGNARPQSVHTGKNCPPKPEDKSTANSNAAVSLLPRRLRWQQHTPVVDRGAQVYNLSARDGNATPLIARSPGVSCNNSLRGSNGTRRVYNPPPSSAGSFPCVRIGPSPVYPLCPAAMTLALGCAWAKD